MAHERVATSKITIVHCSGFVMDERDWPICAKSNQDLICSNMFGQGENAFYPATVGHVLTFAPNNFMPRDASSGQCVLVVLFGDPHCGVAEHVTQRKVERRESLGYLPSVF
jgi:hypothetical protein